MEWKGKYIKYEKTHIRREKKRKRQIERENCADVVLHFQNTYIYVQIKRIHTDTLQLQLHRLCHCRNLFIDKVE